ncbi:ABC transporter permease [Gaopeijia maritima]|uniref:ABC transporter permease n=1 Tax=Gaopeijia maritima TaxID=3119007 RepID=A0ABU9E628_9BACT
MRISRLRAIARKEWIQLRRDPRSMILAFALPLILLVFFGYAITWDVDDIGIALVDHDRTPTSRQLAETLVASGLFTIAAHPDTEREADHLLTRGQVKGIVVVPAGFTAELTGGRAARLQMLVDGSDANTATIALNYAEAIVSRFARGVLLQGRRVELPVEADTRIWYNPTLASRNMIVPGLIAVIMSIIAAMLTALTIAREWERGTMEQLASTPVTRLEVVLGKLLPYLAIGLFDVAVTVTAGMLLFGTPLNGSTVELAGFTLLFLTGALGLGIFISAAVKSQVLATQIAMVATYLPAVLLSGFLFDIASMPPVLRGFTYLIPARYFVTVTRGIFLKGVGLEVLWPQALFMAGFAVVGLALATRAFRKEIDA